MTQKILFITIGGSSQPIVTSIQTLEPDRVQLERLLKEHSLSPDLKTRVRSLIEICRGLDAWDRFDHRQAWDYLSQHMRHPEIRSLGLFLKRVMGSRQIMDEGFDPPETMKEHGYEIVQDLCLNAERRAHQQRYDDAVGRLYRALELMAQIRLKLEYKIKTGDVDLQLVLEHLRSFCEQRRDPDQGRIELALRDSYEVLAQWGEDPLGALYQEYRKQLNDILRIRNYSLFAHGFEPISQESYERFSQILRSFLDTGISQVAYSDMASIQFPRQIFTEG